MCPLMVTDGIENFSFGAALRENHSMANLFAALDSPVETVPEVEPR
jgi:hypothetical protein